MITETTPRTSATLDRLLDEELAYSPQFRGAYSTHLAMALVALHQMGASPDVLQDTFDAHVRSELEPRDDVEDLAARREEVARDGIEATVAARVPDLVAGPASQLFHPVIRLAYALEAGHDGQVAAALLDWERRHHVYPVPEPAPGERRLPDVAAALSGHPEGTWPATFDLDGISRRPELREALEGLVLDERTLDDISAFALAAHLTADDFVTLHLVTGSRAVRTVGGHVDPATAQRLAVHAAPVVAVAHAAVGAPPLLGPADLDALRRHPLPSRQAVAARAVTDHDPHVIKLANVALAEEERSGDPLYRMAAGRAVGLLPRAQDLLEPA